MEKCGNGTNKYCRFPTLDFRLALNRPQGNLSRCISASSMSDHTTYFQKIIFLPAIVRGEKRLPRVVATTSRKFLHCIVASDKKPSRAQSCAPRRGALAALAVLALGGGSLPCAQAGNLVATVAAVKRSVVGVGSYLPTRSPAISFTGTGFVVGDGLTVVTNAHVVPEVPDSEHKEVLGIVVADGEGIAFRAATLEVRDREHDLARLRLAGPPLPALRLGDPDELAEGRELAFTGFPLGVALGLHPATHRALLAAITPAVAPTLGARRLDVRTVAQLRRTPFPLLQLDATAYPGNSGSPVFDPDSGALLGVINMGIVKGTKESAITSPSGITYAVPVQFVRELLQQKSP
jgi:S1-C subfamily serine protease